MIKRVAITAAGSSLGTLLQQVLQEEVAPERIVAVDHTPATVAGSAVVFRHRDPREEISDLFLEHWIDTAFHLAPELTPGTPWARPLDTCLAALDRFFDGCHRAGVLRVVVCSTAAVYGPSWERPSPRTEGSPREGARLGIPELKTAQEFEARCERFAEEHPEVHLSVLRPVLVVGATTRSFFTRWLGRRWVILPTPMAPLQLCHERDAARALLHLARAGARGAFNLAGQDVLGPGDVERVLGQEVRWVRRDWLAAGMRASRRLPLREHSTMPPEVLSLLSQPWLVDTTRLRNEAGFAPGYTSRQALEELVTSRGLGSLHLGGQPGSPPPPIRRGL